MQKTRHYIKAIAIAIVAMATMSGCTDDDTQQAYDLNGYWQGSIQGDYYSDRYACAYLTADDADTAVWYLDGEAARERVRMAALFGVDQLCLSDLSSVADYENYSLLEGLD